MTFSFRISSLSFFYVSKFEKKDILKSTPAGRSVRIFENLHRKEKIIRSKMIKQECQIEENRLGMGFYRGVKLKF